MRAPLAVAAAAVVGTGAVAGAAATGYAIWEARQHTLRRVRVPILPPGAADVAVLHISDLHLTGRTQARRDWVAGLAVLEPDLVIATGDFLSAADGVAEVASALAGLLDRPGAFVFGSNDFFGARPINPAKYFAGPSKVAHHKVLLPTDELRQVLTSGGWLDLNNAAGELLLGDVAVALRGVCDPHIWRDRYRLVAGAWPTDAQVRLGVSHAPYLRVLDAMADDGADLILAGHTHGGQVCLPGFGALVTNCDLDRHRVKGLSRHDGAYLHVSAGLGTNPYTPIRVACRPEATVLTLTAGGGRPHDAEAP